MSKDGFSLDFKDFDKKSTRMIEHAYPEASAKGLRLAAQELKLDADNEPPKTPLKEGHLKASGRVIPPEIKRNKISSGVKYGGVKFGVIYAPRLHEMEKKGPWTEPGSGPKFLESKIIRHAKKYMAIVATAIRRAR